MTLEEKILKINEPAIADIENVGLLPTDAADTIENFFEKFVKPRLAQEEVVRQWHEILMEYTDKKNWSELSCCVRFGNNGGEKQSAWGEKGYFKLRRGWLTKNKNDNFEYFFADNAFSAFVYKMALDGFCPSNVDEFRTIFQQHKFPYSFGFFIDNKKNEYKGVTITKGTNPGFLGNYKLSHIFDAGEHFNINGMDKGDALLSNEYYPIGHSDDFLDEPDLIRKMDIDDDMKKVIVAKFLRFVHPFNYFLTPTKKHHICGQPVYKKDIGEDPRMISYVRAYLKKTYPKEYDDFVKRIMWYEDPDAVSATGSERIDITYGLEINSKGEKSVVSGKSSTNVFSDFEDYAKKNGVKTPSAYSASIKRIMRELNLKSLDDLDRCKGEAIEYCSKKIDEEKLKSNKKIYNNIRSALKKYEQYLESYQSSISETENFLKALEDFMRTESKLSNAAIKIYCSRIKKLLEKEYSLADVYGGIEQIIQKYSKGGLLYDPDDHGNTKGALVYVEKMIKSPYIFYRAGWGSFVPKGEHTTGYCINANTLTIYKSIGFVNIGPVIKKIDADNMKELISILDEAAQKNLFAVSNTAISTVYGQINSYAYNYRLKSGNNCNGLFTDNPCAGLLQTRYQNLIDKITK